MKTLSCILGLFTLAAMAPLFAQEENIGLPFTVKLVTKTIEFDDVFGDDVFFASKRTIIVSVTRSAPPMT